MDTSLKTTESSSKMLETLEERLASANLALEAARLELMERRLQMMEKLSPSTSLEQEVRLRQEFQLLEQEIKDDVDTKEN